jgi:imidazolonepropionase-like amidohydrolase
MGTDVLTSFVVPGARLHRELRLFVESGLTPEEALALATRGNGAFLARNGREGLGRLAPGAPADLVVFRDDPTRGLDALDRLQAVVADGRLYTRAQLERYRHWFDGFVFDRVSVYLARRAMERLFGDATDRAAVSAAD